MEVMILQASADTGLIDVTSPAGTAALLSLSLSPTDGYLSDLAHRKPSLEDEAALILLGEHLSHVEALPTECFSQFRSNGRIYASGSSASSQPMDYTEVKRSAAIW